MVRGWLRLSLRATTKQPTALSKVIPERDFLSTEVQKVVVGEIYTVDVELWPTSVVVRPGEKLVLEISSCDSEGVSLFEHNHPEDRAECKLKGLNVIHLGSKFENFLRLPVIPPQ